MARCAAPLAVNAAELRRYSRHLLIPEVGLQGQERLRAARVLVVGAGGLGSPSLQYLAAAGVGTIGVIDDDAVDETNLQRQTLFSPANVGQSKALVAAARLRDLNPSIAVEPLPFALDGDNAREIVRQYDVVLDCTDRFATRYLISDACFFEKKVDVYASIFRFDGQLSVLCAQSGPCYRCLFPEPPPAELTPTCAEGGVLGALAGVVGSWQSAEALKILLGVGEPLAGRILLIDTLRARVREVRFERDPACALCGDAPQIFDVERAPAEVAEDRTIVEIDAEELSETLDDATLLDVREPHEAVLGTIDGSVSIPASQLEARMSELDTARRYVVACRVGVKSLWAVRRLREAGFGRLAHLRGGLLAYAARREDFEFF
ncbi:MAG TPA: molybdopterin-synthase adenylyltransferase MoeB [Candidatus Cybelea sp.]|nr:molybdopterin-synthase adenylyltransferase MoeB [Candidatus Cybelea sp.]